jgi:tRNA threonylcarbamoyladenosine biosynthesis protein TsaB
MKILAIDTSTEACSAAIFIDNEVIERYQLAPRGHGALILGMIDSLLAESGCGLNQMDVLAYGRGPGSFTGVRIAASVTQGLAFGAGLPVLPISSLAAIAEGQYREAGSEKVLVAIDARIQEVYWGAYVRDVNDTMRLVDEECVSEPEKLPSPESTGWYGVGSGWSAYREILESRFAPWIDGWHGEFYPKASNIAYLASHDRERDNWVSAEMALPVYLRNKVV